MTELRLINASGKAWEIGQSLALVVGVDVGAGQDRTAVITAIRHEHGIVVLTVDDHELPHALRQTLAKDHLSPVDLEAIKACDDTIKAPRSGGPPPHTLKNYNRRRSGR